MAISNLQNVQLIELGRQREMKAYTLTFDLSEFATKFGSGKAVLVHKRPRDNKPYIAKTTTSGNTLSWKISQADVWYSGEGQAEIRWIMDTDSDNETDRIIKSAVFVTSIERSIVDETEECTEAVVYLVDDSDLIAKVGEFGENLAEAEERLDVATEETRNLNMYGVALQYISAGGKITKTKENVSTYIGIGEWIPCKPETKYTVTFYGAAWGEEEKKFTTFIGFNRTDETEPFKRIQGTALKNSYTFETPTEAYEMFVDFYNSKGIQNEDGELVAEDGALDKIRCQIELGEKSTEFIEPMSAVDIVVRREINGMAYAAPPEYYMENLEAACSAALEHSMEIGLNEAGTAQDGIQFVFFADPHWGDNAKHSPALALYAKNHTAARYVICGGDALTSSTVKQNMVDMAQEFAKAFKPVAPVEFVFGNHDRNQNNNEEDKTRYLTDTEVYATLFRNTSADGAWDGYFNYYIDDAKSNTRLVFVTQFYDGGDAEEKAWIEKVTKAAQTMNVIYIVHSTKAGVYQHKPKIEEMQDQYGNVKAVLSGHRHLDAVECYQSGVTGRKPVPIITIDADCMKRLKKVNESGTTENRADAKAGTIEEQCLDIVTINYKTNTVYCDRIGRGSSRKIVDGVEVTEVTTE